MNVRCCCCRQFFRCWISWTSPCARMIWFPATLPMARHWTNSLVSSRGCRSSFALVGDTILESLHWSTHCYVKSEQSSRLSKHEYRFLIVRVNLLNDFIWIFCCRSVLPTSPDAETAAAVFIQHSNDKASFQPLRVGRLNRKDTHTHGTKPPVRVLLIQDQTHFPIYSFLLYNGKCSTWVLY